MDRGLVPLSAESSHLPTATFHDSTCNRPCRLNKLDKSSFPVHSDTQTRPKAGRDRSQMVDTLPVRRLPHTMKIMKSIIVNCACGLFLFGAVATTKAQSTWIYFISNAGGGNSLLTWSVSGDLAAVPGASWMSAGSFMAVPISAPGIYADSYLADGTPKSLLTLDGSYFYDAMGGQESPISGYYTYNAAGSSDDGFGLLLSVSPTRLGDRLLYNPGTQSALIPVDFSDFNPGTYQSEMSQFIPALTVNLTVEPVPEPSTLALAVGAVIGAALTSNRGKKFDMRHEPPNKSLQAGHGSQRPEGRDQMSVVSYLASVIRPACLRSGR